MIIFQLIFFIGFIILLMILGFIFRVLSIFGGRKQRPPFGFTENDEEARQDYSEQTTSSQRKKIFSDTDGEYVDFEEIKK